MTQIEHKRNKAEIRSFMRAQYSDERLVELLAFAQDGKLNYVSCCCFIGVANADHALRPRAYSGDDENHYTHARELPGAFAAERAYEQLVPWSDDARRRRILIPMVRAEIRRRDRLASASSIAKSIIADSEVRI